MALSLNNNNGVLMVNCKVFPTSISPLFNDASFQDLFPILYLHL